MWVPHLTIMKVAYQGVAGAYSESAIFKLLGRTVQPAPQQTFEQAFQAVQDGVTEAALIPIQNSLGGSIHGNYDLLLRFSLHIVAELDFRVEHCLLVLPGVKKSEVNVVTSHPQALAQCDNYIRAWGIEREVSFDTAGSAKMIAEKQLINTAAIASDLAAEHYGLQVLERGIEDVKHNYTRFLLLKKQGVSPPRAIPAKVSIVFSLSNAAGALFKAIACFSMRDIDLTKIESRPGIVNTTGAESSSAVNLTERRDSASSSHTYQYMFYLDFLGHLSDSKVQYALRNLQELATFIRVFGCYPSSGLLIHELQQATEQYSPAVSAAIPSLSQFTSPQGMCIGIIGFGNFGQFLARTLVRNPANRVYATSRTDYASVAKGMGVQFFNTFLEMVHAAQDDDRSKDSQQNGLGLDCLILAPSILSFELVLKDISQHREQLSTLLVVDVLSVKVHAKRTMLQYLPPSADILCTHPMFGPESGKTGWQNLPFVYDIVRVSPLTRNRLHSFLSLFEEEGCRMVPMTCEEHDELAAESQFITHFVGRVLSRLSLKSTPINTKGYQSLLELVDNTCKDSFDLFLALYKHNARSTEQLSRFSKTVEALSEELHHSANHRLALNLLNPLIHNMSASETVRLHALTQQMIAERVPVVALNVGEPDFAPPANVVSATSTALLNGHTHYVSVQGDLELRTAVCDYLSEYKRLTYRPENVLICNGGKQAIFQAIQVICREGDEVIVPVPYWNSHVEIPKLARATPILVQTFIEHDFCLDPQILQNHITKSTRMIILCNPANPTGTVYTRERLEAIAAVLKLVNNEHIWVLSDEIYERLVYDDAEAVPFATLDGMKERTITINGVSKAYAMTGFRIGWMVGPKNVIQAATKLQGQITSCAGSLAQRAAISALKTPNSVIQTFITITKEKRDVCLAKLRAMGIPCVKPLGAFYLFPSIAKYLNRITPSGVKIDSAAKFCEALLSEKGVSVVPGSAFGAPEHIRISYATSLTELQRGLSLLEEFLTSIK